MEAKELRLSNLIRLYLGVSDLGAEYREATILGIHDEYGTIRIRIDQTDTWHLTSNFEAIPLTEEWLLKFGFEDVTGVYYTLHISPDFKLLLIPADGFYPQLDKADENNWQSVSLNKIDHVHQLQNLYFALTGEELSIK